MKLRTMRHGWFAARTTRSCFANRSHHIGYEKLLFKKCLLSAAIPKAERIINLAERHQNASSLQFDYNFTLFICFLCTQSIFFVELLCQKATHFSINPKSRLCDCVPSRIIIGSSQKERANTIPKRFQLIKFVKSYPTKKCWCLNQIPLQKPCPSYNHLKFWLNRNGWSTSSMQLIED